MIGKELAHYRVIERLGAGGMGEVYLAEDSRLHRRVALKILPSAMAVDPERLERFAREAKAVAGLNHPNIVTVHAIEQVDDLHILVMELVEGGTLGAEIPEGGLPEERFFELAIPLADAISRAHERGVTHRDLKPSNVMITDDGRVKVVDFGLAKLRQETQARESTVLMDSGLTEEGRILGTYPYMAPEQLKGHAADERSDIFSLGVVLYEMATGKRPFAGDSPADLISSILRDDSVPVHELNSHLPRHLARIIDHCLEKDPDRRFQTAKDLRNELQSLCAEIESERILRSSFGLGWRRGVARRVDRLRDLRGAKLGLALGAAALVVAGAIALAIFLGGDRSATPAESPGAGDAAAVAPAVRSRPSLAILFFQNLSGDPELEWLRVGLTEMLITDLSQSPGVRVVGTDQVYQILAELDALQTAVVSADLVRRIAEAADVETVILGSYLQAGDTLQVNLTLKDPRSGETVDAQRVQGTGEAGVFSIVDRLSGEILERLVRTGHPELAQRDEPSRSLESVTTSSVEAYRLYIEGMKFRREVKLEESLPLFEQAVERDPEFAMAYARIAITNETLGREQEMERALEQAMAHAERLPPQERFYIEGLHFSRTRSGYGQAIRALTEGLELYPDHQSARYHLALLQSYLELHEDAAAELEDLRRRGYDYDGLYNSMAEVYGALGREEHGRALLESLVERNEERWAVHLIFGWHLTSWGDVRGATEELARTEELRPGSPFQDLARWRLAVLAERWPSAQKAARELTESRGAYWQWRGGVATGVEHLYHGRFAAGLSALDEASNAYDEEEPLAGTSRNLEAELLHLVDRPRESLARAQEARRVAEGDWPAWEGIFWAALAEERLGSSEAADLLAAELGALADQVPGPVEDRLHHHLLGLLADARGDRATAIRELRTAESLLPQRGFAWHRHRLPDHVPVWYDLAEALREGGDPRAAEEVYRRIAASEIEHLYHPVQFVRSHYFLGRLQEARGDQRGARASYERFLSYWEDGDLDRERVEDARRRFSALD